MRRSVYSLLVAALSFVAGVAAFMLAATANQAQKREEPLKVSFCELVRDPERYNGKVVQTKAVLYRDQKPFIYDWSCSTADIYTSPPFVMISDDLDHALPEWADGFVFCGNALNGNKEGLAADVVIVGAFKLGHPTTERAPDFRIKPENILQLSQPSRRR
jgi:hypothetical protein